MSDVLFGLVEPTGTLPMTWVASAEQLPINDGDGQTSLFPYGFGLGYGDEAPGGPPRHLTTDCG